MQKLWKLVKIWQGCREFNCENFLRHNGAYDAVAVAVVAAAAADDDDDDEGDDIQ